MTNNYHIKTNTFTQFFNSEKSSGILLITCTILSLLIANSPLSDTYFAFWHTAVAGMSIEHWINDGLMTIFFLFIGLELERELYNGELSTLKSALLPIIAAIGGIFCPALIHFLFNGGTNTQSGIGIPMATDIAFALGALAILGNRIPFSLKIFLTALAVMDDLGAIIVIAIFYTDSISIAYLASALSVFALLVLLNKKYRIMALTPYLIGGMLMWFFMLKSGIHATVAGVILAFAIPFSAKADDDESPSHRLEHILHKPVSFLILPIFALTNTGIIISDHWRQELFSENSIGILVGLIVGKPLGIFLLSFFAVSIGICKLPSELNWKHIFGAGLLGGIGFTMSIFITNLAFNSSNELITSSKIAVLIASLIAGVLGYFWLRMTTDNVR